MKGSVWAIHAIQGTPHWKSTLWPLFSGQGMRHAMHSYALPLGTTLGKLLGQHLLPADSQSGICISSWKEMLINIPSQRQVCYNSVRGRVREREKKIVKRRGKNWKPHRTSQEPKTSGLFVDGRRKDYSTPRRTMQIDWKQGDTL